jgi:hypothetical protein
MTQKTRLIILFVCIFCFATVTPLIILYSLGDRIDFIKMRIISTGGIYVRTFPTADQITIDSKDSEKPGFLSNSIFVPNLLPGSHYISITKNGYHNYYKTLPVQEKEVTKLENVSLFKTNITFTELSNLTTQTTTVTSPFAPQNQPDKFIIKNNNLYYSTTTQNAKLTTIQKTTPILKNLVAFALSDNNIIWISTTGNIYQNDLNSIISGKITSKNYTKLTEDVMNIDKTGFYKITTYGNELFINSNSKLLELNYATEKLEEFATDVKDEKFSPDGKNIIYYTDKGIFVSLLSDIKNAKVSLYKSDDISNLYWLNNDYIVFTSGDKIIISEIDYRGNINTITLPLTTTSPKLIFNQQENKLYILTGKTVLVSEKLMP